VRIFRTAQTRQACKSIDYRLVFFPKSLVPAAFYRFLPLFLADKWRTDDTHKSFTMSIEVTGKANRQGTKIWYTYEWGKGPGQRKAAGVFTYAHPKNQIEKNHNQQALALLDTTKSQMIIDHQATGTPFIPRHRFKNNFLDYYQEFVNNNERPGNRHLRNSLAQFELFVKKRVVSPIDITEDLCKRFRQKLKDQFTGKTPADYFSAFKRVIRAATKEGYFRIHPAGDLNCQTNPSKGTKDFLEAPEYLALVETPIPNHEVRDAFIFCCYTGLRWCDVLNLTWSQIQRGKIISRIIQKKTNKPVEITLHEVAQTILDNRANDRGPLTGQRISTKEATRHRRIFKLPTHNGANKAIGKWAKDAGIDKHITWHSARLSFSILLQDAQVDSPTVALLLGHTTTKYVNETYKRHRPKNQTEVIAKLPAAHWHYN